ncbi:hypothetical protein ZHAS_00016065 [Anopheles sinensis]|uniref:Uncharacterized protein n=1 Tax=Anopheles sinensis TaxID=74873 RepID=A0A084WCZ8_ANOSI|nr:hypothetical protein ZHAS_00016065 [Anopheles sinensis]
MVGANLKLDVAFNLKASYGKHLATNTAPKAVTSSSRRTKTPEKDRSPKQNKKQNVEKNGVAKSQPVAGSEKDRKKLLKIKRKPDEAPASKPKSKEFGEKERSLPMTDVQRIAKVS